MRQALWFRWLLLPPPANCYRLVSACARSFENFVYSSINWKLYHCLPGYKRTQAWCTVMARVQDIELWDGRARIQTQLSSVPTSHALCSGHPAITELRQGSSWVRTWQDHSHGTHTSIQNINCSEFYTPRSLILYLPGAHCHTAKGLHTFAPSNGILGGTLCLLITIEHSLHSE